MFLVVFWSPIFYFLIQWDGELTNKPFFWRFVSWFFWMYGNGAQICGMRLRVRPARYPPRTSANALAPWLHLFRAFTRVILTAPDLKCCVLSSALFTPLRPSPALAGVLFAVGTVYQSIGYLAPGKKKRNDLA